ncbi:TonB-dependent receptor [Pelagicoccus sp. NFK12]|uniref:TonB-dependent receptor n=1 Tax=Pelagicoccus enzymogenes TaxID=2773457 RepID=A0A927IJM0_9BACT|nr:TonB-dependent receptor [Pelagicoccus enzymogenes]MBD5782009.1 TonB-dependent receptor [Pelagicoccus enzymogenes]
METHAEPQEFLTTNRKALTINLDNEKYGTFAEIGAGQETCRNFFQAGGAAGTIAKTISAYDMTFSDSIYGKVGRYVSLERVIKMIDHEYALLEERLKEDVGEEKTFFAYANTMKAKSYKGGDDTHGWMGIRFQTSPGCEPSEIYLHCRMWDPENVQQQHAVGILGTNLIYGACYLNENVEAFIESLVDNVGNERIEVDFIKFRGPAFKGVDDRIANLHLVRRGLTNAVLFSPEGEITQPSEALYKKAILVERGSFRPVTRVNIDMLKCSGAQFIQEPSVQGKDVIVLAEITMNNLLASGKLDYEDYLARIDTIGATGNYVLISNYFEFYRLTSYFRRYTGEMIGVCMGINNLLEIFNEKYYANLAGGILESFGRLLKNSVRLYIYPMKQKAYRRYLKIHKGEGNGEDSPPKSASSETKGSLTDDLLITCNNLRVKPQLSNLYLHLLENGYIEHIRGIDDQLLEIFSRDILAAIADKDPIWEQMVPPAAIEFIKSKQLFGYTH